MKKLRYKQKVMQNLNGNIDKLIGSIFGITSNMSNTYRREFGILYFPAK